MPVECPSGGILIVKGFYDFLARYLPTTFVMFPDTCEGKIKSTNEIDERVSSFLDIAGIHSP